MFCWAKAPHSWTLCSNKLTDLPDELAELQHLRVLRIKYNSLTKLPEVLVKMHKLEVLELSGNQITVVDDKVLAGLSNVRQDLSFCSLLKTVQYNGNLAGTLAP